MTKTGTTPVIIHAGDDVRLQNFNGYAMHYIRGVALNSVNSDDAKPHLKVKERWSTYISIEVDLNVWTPTVMKCAHTESD